MSKSAPCSDRTCLNQTVGLVVFNSFPDGMTLVGGGGKHSIFAKVFISLLEENTGVLNTTQLFSELQPVKGQGLRVVHHTPCDIPVHPGW